MKLFAPLLTASVLLVLLAGCGGSGEQGSGASTGAAPAQSSKAPAGATARECTGGAGKALRLRATGISCAEGLALAKEWKRREGCAPDPGASRSGCELSGSYACLTVATERGLTVSCARPSGSIAFTVKRD